MTEQTEQADAEAIAEWTKSVFSKGVQALLDKGVIPYEVVEARPAWALPKTLVIGQVRESNRPDAFMWVICGGVPTDHVGSGAATTPREAARHFSLKWQLDATRIADVAAADALATQAEVLYKIADDDKLWKDQQH